MLTMKEFKYGENVTEMSAEYAKPEIITGILPEGQDGAGRIVHINLVSSGGFYLWDKASVNKYGKIPKLIDFGKLTTKKIKIDSEDDERVKKGMTVGERDTDLEKTLSKKLLKKAKRYMDNHFTGDDEIKVSVTGLDPCWCGLGIKDKYAIKLGDKVHCYSSAHGINVRSYCLSMEIDYFNHENDRYVIGPYIPNNYFDPKITKR